MSISENERYWQHRAQRAEAECERLRADNEFLRKRRGQLVIERDQARGDLTESAPPPRSEPAFLDGDFTLSLRELQHGLNCLSVDNAMDRPDFQLAWDIYEAAKQCATPPPEGETRHVPPIMNNTPDGKPDEIPDTPEQAHGDALAALNRIALIVYDEESPEPTFVGDMADEDFDVVRQSLTASGVPYVPEGLGYADITSPEYNGWINLLWGNDQFPVGMVPPPYSTQIKSALASAPAVPNIPESVIDEIVDEFEWMAEDEDGRDASRTPADWERLMLKDFAMLLLSEAPNRIAAAPSDGESDD